MFQKVFRSAGTGIASVILTAATFLSYILGLIRDKTLAYYFGATELTDAYNSAFLLPDFIFNLFIAGALAGVFIPIYMEHRHKGEKYAHELGSIFLSVMSVVIIIVSIIALLFTPQLIGFFIDTSLLSESSITLTIELTRVMLLSPILFGLSNTFGAILLGHHHFTAYSLSPAMYNIGIIVGTMIFQESFGIYGATVGTIIGMVLHLCIRMYNMKYIDFKFKWDFNIRHKGFLKIIVLMIPRAIGLLSLVLVLTMFSFIGSSLDSGSYAASVYARNFQSFSISLFGVSLATAVLPTLSQFAVEKNMEKFQYRLEKSMRQILYLTLPAAVGMILLAEPMIAVILGGGAFDEQSIMVTSTLLLIFSLSIPFEGLMHLYSRAFYAFQKVIFPAISFVAFALTVWLVITYSVDTLGVQSFAYAWTAGVIVQIILLYLFFHHIFKLTKVSYKRVGIGIIKFLIGTVCMASSLLFLFSYTDSNILKLMIGVCIGAPIYFVVTYLLRCEEMSIVDKLYKKLIPNNKSSKM